MEFNYEDIIKEILEKYCDPILAKTKKITKEKLDKIKIDLNITFIKYLKNSSQKYSKIKTILYRTEPKYIYNFFECPLLEKLEEHKTELKKNNKIKADDINNLLNISNFLIIQGTGGMGKSTLMKHLFINEITKKDLVPVFIELKDINDLKGEYKINDLIYNKLCVLGSTLDKTGLEYALNSGCFLFLLDGYDEISSENRDYFFKELDSFCDKYSGNKYIISTRPYSDFIEFQRFTILKICDFDKGQVLSLIKRIEYDNEIKERFIKAVDKELYNRHKSFASNPLLLNIMLLTFDNYAEIPQKLHLFYANAFETLYSKHDATKSGYRRELKSGLSYDLFKKVFSCFCFTTYFQGKIEFSYDELIGVLKKVPMKIDFNIKNYIDDLVNSVCVLYKEGLNYKFSHRSFQEYFTAIFLKELSDTNMTKMARQLINKDFHKIRYDNVFYMLYDMAEDRVEQNILLPIIKDLEKKCQNEDKYDFYLKKLNPIIHYRQMIFRGTSGISLLMHPSSAEISFVYDFINYYTYQEQKTNYGKQSLIHNTIEKIIKSKNYEPGEMFYGEERFNDEEIYNIFKKTTAGINIQKLSELNEYLSNKQKETELDLSGLLME